MRGHHGKKCIIGFSKGVAVQGVMDVVKCTKKYFQTLIVVTGALGVTVSSAQAATSDYSVRVSAFAKYFDESDIPDAKLSENNLTTLTIAAASGPPSTLILNGGSASTSLATAGIIGYARAFGNSAAGEIGEGRFSAEFRDHVTFDLPDGMNTATIKAVFDIKGAITSNSSPENWQVNGALTFGLSGDGGIIAQDGLYDYSEPLFDHQLVGEWEVTDGVPVFIKALLSGSANAFGGGINLDFTSRGSNRLSFLMPDGTQFSSASGALLTAVPLPAPIYLLGCGIVLLIRRRSSQ